MNMDKQTGNGEIPSGNFIAGFRQSERLIRRADAKKVYVAYDAARQIAEKISALCREKGIDPDASYSMEQLGKLCGIGVGCAVCVER